MLSYCKRIIIFSFTLILRNSAHCVLKRPPRTDITYQSLPSTLSGKGRGGVTGILQAPLEHVIYKTGEQYIKVRRESTTASGKNGSIGITEPSSFKPPIREVSERIISPQFLELKPSTSAGNEGQELDLSKERM